MKMTSHTDYALRMLIYLAIRPSTGSTVSEIADSYNLSRNHMLKVALSLRNAGYINTTRGRSGGVSLALPADQINIGKTIRQLEGNPAVVECMKADGGHCILTPACKLKTIAEEALEAYLRVFDKYQLSDITSNQTALRMLLQLDFAAAPAELA